MPLTCTYNTVLYFAVLQLQVHYYSFRGWKNASLKINGENVYFKPFVQVRFRKHRGQ